MINIIYSTKLSLDLTAAKLFLLLFYFYLLIFLYFYLFIYLFYFFLPVLELGLTTLQKLFLMVTAILLFTFESSLWSQFKREELYYIVIN